MTRLIRYDPFREMQRVVDNMNSLLAGPNWWDSRLWDENWAQDSASTPLAIDMHSTDSEVVLRTALPGIQESDIDINVNNNILTISAETRSENEQGGEEQNWHLRELRYGKFSRSIRLPEDVNADQANALLENGVLTVRLPRQQPNPAKRIAVKAKQIISGEKHNNKAAKK